MRTKPQDPDMAAMKNSPVTANVREADFHGAVVPHRGMTTQNLSGVFAAIHAQPEKTPSLVSHAVV